MKVKVVALLALVGVTLFAAGHSTGETTESVRLVVQNVEPQSPAEVAGIRPGDIFLEYDGVPTAALKDLFRLKDAVKTDSVWVVVLRENERIELRLPAGQMGEYLNEMMPEIQYKEDAVVIHDIPKLSWSTGKFNSFFAALEAIANHLGIDRDYVYINGVSAAPFRLHFYKSWCPSSPDPTCGYNSGELALHALGLEYRSKQVQEDDTAGYGELRKEIVASIDKGMPVIAIHLIDVAEWGIITGYQDAGMELVCRTYYDRREGYDLGESLPWAVYLIDAKKDMPSDKENYKRSFAVALENLTTPVYGEYTSGLAALDTWIEHLRTDDFAVMDSAQYAERMTANAWIYDRLVHDRDLAAEYLDRVAGEFPELSEKLKGLAELYRAESELLKPTEDVVAYGFNMMKRDEWSSKMREEEMARLKKAREKEEQALMIWREIVDSITEE